MIEAWCFSFGGGRAPRRSPVGSRSARPVATASAEHLPAVLHGSVRRFLCTPTFDPAQHGEQLGGSNLREGGRPTTGKMSLSNRRRMRSPWLATHPGENFACHSRAMASKLSSACLRDLSRLASLSRVDARGELLAGCIALFAGRFQAHVGIDAEARAASPCRRSGTSSATTCRQRG